MSKNALRDRLGLPPLSRDACKSEDTPSAADSAVNVRPRLLRGGSLPVQGLPRPALRRGATDPPPASPRKTPTKLVPLHSARGDDVRWKSWTTSEDVSGPDVTAGRASADSMPPSGRVSGNLKHQEAGDALPPPKGASGLLRPLSVGSGDSSPRVLLGRLQGVWQRRAAEDADLKKPLKVDTTAAPVESAKIPVSVSAQTSARSTPTPQNPEGASKCSSRASRLSPSTPEQPESVPRPPFEASVAAEAWEPPRSSRQPLRAFTRLRTCELSPMPDTESVLGSFHAAAALGRGLFWPATFERYAMGRMPGMSKVTGACLGPAEFGRLLRDHGVELGYDVRCRALELVSGSNCVHSTDFQSFFDFIEATARLWVAADPTIGKNTKGKKKKRRGKKPEEAALAVARAVFNSYDVERTGVIDREGYMKLLRDKSQVPQNIEEWQDLCRQVSFCRQDGLPGPLDFPDFLRFVVRLSSDGMDISD